MSAYPDRTIAIIGSGCSGALVATQLLRQATQPLVIKLIEPRSPVGCGVAYSTTFDEHLLNVPVGNMSAISDEPSHFLNWLRTNGSLDIHVNAATFVPRQLYGDYLQSVLRTAEANAAPGVRLEWIQDEAIALEPASEGALIHFRQHAVIYADRIVLALGNFPASPPPVQTPDFYRSPRYIGSAWSSDLRAIAPNETVLLIGSSLTMVDVAIALQAQGHQGKIHAISRHGLLPQPHKAKSVYPCFDPSTISLSVRSMVHQVRQTVKVAADHGQDWRAVVDALRPVTQHLWQSLPIAEQKRFLRHVRAYWDIHRHRIAPEIADTINLLQRSGQLVVAAGRIQSYREDTTGVDVTFRPRSTQSEHVLRINWTINCTSPTSNFAALQHPLITNLRSQQLICPDPLKLGLRTAANGALLNAGEIASSVFFTLGSPRKADLWESIAVPEIRVQALALAAELFHRSHTPSTPTTTPSTRQLSR